MWSDSSECLNLPEHVKATESGVKGNGTQELRRPVLLERYPVFVAWRTQEYCCSPMGGMQVNPMQGYP